MTPYETYSEFRRLEACERFSRILWLGRLTMAPIPFRVRIHR